jgi:hypothetical protein
MPGYGTTPSPWTSESKIPDLGEVIASLRDLVVVGPTPCSIPPVETQSMVSLMLESFTLVGGLHQHDISDRSGDAQQTPEAIAISPAPALVQAKAASKLICKQGFKKPTENKKSASSDPVGFQKNRPNLVKTDRNPFDSKCKQLNPQPMNTGRFCR